MKKVFLASMAVLAFSLTACSNDVEDVVSLETSENENLRGSAAEWQENLLLSFYESKESAAATCEELVYESLEYFYSVDGDPVSACKDANMQEFENTPSDIDVSEVTFTEIGELPSKLSNDAAFTAYEEDLNLESYDYVIVKGEGLATAGGESRMLERYYFIVPDNDSWKQLFWVESQGV